MTDHDPLVKELLEEHVPLRLDAKPDWMEVERLAARGSARGATRHPAAIQLKKSKTGAPRGLGAILAAPVGGRRLSALVAFVVVVLGVGAAIAGARSGLWWNGASSPYAIQTSSAEKLVEFTLTTGYSIWSRGTTIAMWRIPQDNGWVCYRVALASPAPTGAHDLGEGSCYQGILKPPPGESMRVQFGTTAPGYSWLISGQVDPSSGITGVELDSATGALPLSYANGWFLGDLPPSGSGEKLPEGGPYVLVGRDNDGNVVARVDLEHARASIENPKVK